MVGGSDKQLFQTLLLGPLLFMGGRRMTAVSSKANLHDLLWLKELIEAVRYVEQGHAGGKVIVTV